MIYHYNKNKSGVYIGRPKFGGEWRFGNPFVIGKDGDRTEVIAKFKNWLDAGENHNNIDATKERRLWILNNLHLIKDQDLICWCDYDKEDCHGRVLIETSEPNPNNDGVTHINIYSKGKTELGRSLSSFFDSPFTYDMYGDFRCVEGFWYYYLTGQKYQEFRLMNGYQAKTEGKKLRDDRIDKDGLSDIDREVILEAVRCKLRQNKSIRAQLKNSELPFFHYYNYNGKVVDLPQYQWMINEISRIRSLLKGTL